MRTRMIHMMGVAWPPALRASLARRLPTAPPCPLRPAAGAAARCMLTKVWSLLFRSHDEALRYWQPLAVTGWESEIQHGRDRTWQTYMIHMCNS